MARAERGGGGEAGSHNRRNHQMALEFPDDGGFLRTVAGECEEELPAAERAARRRERSTALCEAIRAEPVRRMTRRAGISSYEKNAGGNAAAGEDVVLTVLRQICDVALFNLTREVYRIADHLRRRTVTTEILREALKSLGVKLHGNCQGPHSPCRTLKQRNANSPHRIAGAVGEIEHERTNAGHPCVYFTLAGFTRLVRFYFVEQAGAEHVLKIGGPGVVSCIQLVVESALLEILTHARRVVQEATRRKSDTSAPTRKTIYARDLKLVVLPIVRARHPLLQGRLRPVMDVQQQQAAAPKAKAKARAKCAAKAKPKPKAKAG